MRQLAERTGLGYHAFASVFCEDLATLRRYTMKIAAHIDAGHFLLWTDYDPAVLAAFLDQVRDRFLDPDRSCEQRCADRLLTLARPVTPSADDLVDATLF